MLYTVGYREDLSYLNESAKPRVAASENYDLYETGTKLSFKALACGAMLVAIIEPAIAITINR